MKSRTKGYASLDYEPAGYRPSKLAKVDVLLNGDPVDAFSSITHRDEAYDFGKRMVERLKELMATPTIFDGRNIYDPARVRALGFHYEGVGRP